MAQRGLVSTEAACNQDIAFITFNSFSAISQILSLLGKLQTFNSIASKQH